MAFTGIEARECARALNKSNYDPAFWYEARRNHIGENYVAKIDIKTGRPLERIYSS